MIVRRLVENINVARRGANPARITVRQSGVVVAQRFGTVNITQIGNTETVVAAEALGGHRVITTDGYYADASNTTHAYRVFGVTIGAASIGTVATVRTFGEIAESGWNWTMGEPVFLGANGNVTQTPPSAPSLCVVIGRPKNATTLFVDIQETVFLG